MVISLSVKRCFAGGTEEGFSDLLLGFYVAKEAHWLVRSLLKDGRLPLIIDLDETLVMANTLHGLEAKMREAESRK